MSLASVSQENIAVNRFGYGARGDELELAKKNPNKWIKAQLQPIEFNTKLPHSNDVLTEHALFQKTRKQNKNKKQTNQQINSQYPRATLRQFLSDGIERTINSSNSVSWRLLDFFSNHFSVSASGRLLVGLSATLEREAIAPNLLGKFEDMLLAVEQHPAMLIYLNNEKSFGPNSRLSKKHKKGLNENLAREILELHTLGIDGGYKQIDVTELAKAITGWSVKHPVKERSAGFVFRSYGHEPGERYLLNKKYAQHGSEQGKQMLRDLAMHPCTVNHVCFKLAHHFVSDTPSKELLRKMVATWQKSQGNIMQVMHTLFDEKTAWLATPEKFKTPKDFVISTMRALSSPKIEGNLIANSLIDLGQKPFGAGSPKGYSDKRDDWLGASAFMARIDWSARLSGYRKRVKADKVMSVALGSSVSENTYQMVMRAESRPQALTLLLMSPEFQWR